MNPKVKEALEGSIKKWEAIVESTEAADEGTYNCPLCQLFNNICCRNEQGEKCIVAIKADGNTCNDTPYTKWQFHQERFHNGVVWHRIEGCQTCLELAQEEVDFLKSLREEDL